jgi:hypothetical protein
VIAMRLSPPSQKDLGKPRPFSEAYIYCSSRRASRFSKKNENLPEFFFYRSYRYIVPIVDLVPGQYPFAFFSKTHGLIVDLVSAARFQPFF